MAEYAAHPYRKAFAIDCEMVDIEDVNSGVGKAKKFPIQVVVVDENLQVVYNRYIRPDAMILNDNCFIHGISLDKVMRYGIPFGQAQSEVDGFLYNSFVVGHDLEHDLKSMGLQNEIPHEFRRDTATARMFVNRQPFPSNGWQKPSLVDLARMHLNVSIQKDLHDPTEDAITAMKIYNKFKSSPPIHWARPGKA